MNDLRKAAQMALEVLDKCAAVCPASMEHKALRAALAQPEQEPYTSDVTRIMRDAGMTFHLGLPHHKAVIEQMTRVVDLVYAEASIKAAQQFAAALAQPDESFCDTHCTWRDHHPDCALAQPEQTAMPPDIAKVLFDNVESLYVADDLPQLTKWTPMAEYAAKSAAVPGRAEALKQAGYTRRSRQLPKEDEPVAWQERQEIRPGKFGAWYLIDGKPPAKSAMPVGVTYEWRPLYAHPPQRKPLTESEIVIALRDAGYSIITNDETVKALQITRAIERAHWIGDEE